MASIDENRQTTVPSDISDSSNDPKLSPRTPLHRRSNTEPKIRIDKIQSKNGRTENEKLKKLDQNAFCEWVIKCVQHHPPSKTVENMKKA
eukprot:327529_1